LTARSGTRAPGSLPSLNPEPENHMTATMTATPVNSSPRPGVVLVPMDQRPDGPLDPSKFINLVLSVVHHKLRPAPRDREEAQDMVGESMVAIVRASARYHRELGAPSTYLTGCIINACVNFRKKRIVRERHEGIHASMAGRRGVGVEYPTTWSEDSEHRGYEAAQVRQGLKFLRPRDRHILCRLYGIGCERVDRAALAAELGMTRERVRQLHDKARNRLRAAVIGTPVKNLK